MDGSIELYIGAPEHEVPARALSDAVYALCDMLDSLGATRINIGDLKSGSASVTLLAEPQAIHDVETGLQAISSGKEPPSTWTTRTFVSCRKLTASSGYNGVHSVAVNGTHERITIGSELTQELDRLEQERDSNSMVYLGGVTGRLYRLNLRNEHSPEGGIETDQGESVSLSIPEQLIRDVSALMASRVNVWGLIHDSASGKKHVSVDGIEPARRNKQVKTQDVVGILQSSVLDGLDPEEWVRRYRAS